MTHIYISYLFQVFMNKKLCRSFCTNDRSWNHYFWDLRDSRTGISAILNRRAARFNDFFSKVFLYQLFGHPMNFNLNQSDEKSDQPGILGLYDPLASTQAMQDEINLLKSERKNHITMINQLNGSITILNGEVKLLENDKETGKHGFQFHCFIPCFHVPWNLSNKDFNSHLTKRAYPPPYELALECQKNENGLKWVEMTLK